MMDASTLHQHCSCPSPSTAPVHLTAMLWPHAAKARSESARFRTEMIQLSRLTHFSADFRTRERVPLRE